MKKSLQYENHSFDVESVVSRKKDDFVRQHKDDFYPKSQDGGKKLAEVWDKCSALAKEPEAAPTTEVAPVVAN